MIDPDNNKKFCYDLKIYIDNKGDVTITSLFKELLPLFKELSGTSVENKNENCPGT